MARMIDIAVPHTDASYRVMASRPQGVPVHCPPPRSDMSGVGGEADMPRTSLNRRDWPWCTGHRRSPDVREI